MGVDQGQWSGRLRRGWGLERTGGVYVWWMTPCSRISSGSRGEEKEDDGIFLGLASGD